MKKFIFISLSFLLVFSHLSSHAQLSKIADDLMNIIDKAGDTTNVKPSDSLEIVRLKEELQQMRLKQIDYLNKLDIAQNPNMQDSLKIARRKQSIDSLRAITPGFPLIIDKDTLFVLYAQKGGLSVPDRVEQIKHNITVIGERIELRHDSVHLLSLSDMTEIMYGNKYIMSVTHDDALWMNTPRDSLAEIYKTAIDRSITELHEKNSFMGWVKRISFLILIFVFQYFVFFGMNRLFRKAKKIILQRAKFKFKPIKIREYEFLNVERQAQILIFGASLLRYIILFVQILLTIPLLFSIFPQTRDLAYRLFGYVVSPLKLILRSLTDYLPNFIFIVIIWLCVSYLLKGLKYFENEITSERLKIKGFYPDWAPPTYNIIRFLMYAFMVAMMYPYLPGYESEAFQGVSIFVGLIVSLGSSTVIANIIAGMVITYMRPYHIGDRIKLNETIGNVIEKTPLVTRIVTLKNEIVTIPNSFIMSSQTVNYSASARDYGLIIHTNVTLGYDVPWQLVHKLLIQAARATDGIDKNREPFVLETSLEDFYPIYQINAYITDANKLSQIYSDLHKNIQDTFKEAKINIESPMLYTQRNPNTTVEVNTGFKESGN